MRAQPSYKRSASVVTWLVTLLVARVAGKEGGGGFNRVWTGFPGADFMRSSW